MNMKEPFTTDSDKNTMPTPATSSNQPLQNAVIVPPAPQPPQDNQVLQLLVNPTFQMTTAERIGINNIVNEFHRVYQNNFAPQIQEFQGRQGLERASYLICREIDTMRMVGTPYNTILASENLLRRIATVGSYGIMAQPANIVPFENLPFGAQMILMNLTIFILRHFNNNAHQLPHPQA